MLFGIEITLFAKHGEIKFKKLKSFKNLGHLKIFCAFDVRREDILSCRTLWQHFYKTNRARALSFDYNLRTIVKTTLGVSRYFKLTNGVEH